MVGLREGELHPALQFLKSSCTFPTTGPEDEACSSSGNPNQVISQPDPTCPHRLHTEPNRISLICKVATPQPPLKGSKSSNCVVQCKLNSLNPFGIDVIKSRQIYRPVFQR